MEWLTKNTVSGCGYVRRMPEEGLAKKVNQSEVDRGIDHSCHGKERWSSIEKEEIGEVRSLEGAKMACNTVIGKPEGFSTMGHGHQIGNFQEQGIIGKIR